jgi:alanine dehydrogenase
VTANPGLARGVNIAGGHITYAPVAEAVGLPYTPLAEALIASEAA